MIWKTVGSASSRFADRSWRLVSLCSMNHAHTNKSIPCAGCLRKTQSPAIGARAVAGGVQQLGETSDGRQVRGGPDRQLAAWPLSMLLCWREVVDFKSTKAVFDVPCHHWWFGGGATDWPSRARLPGGFKNAARPLTATASSQLNPK